MIYPQLTEQHIFKAVEANYLSFNWADGDYEKYNEEMTGAEKPEHSKCIGYYSFYINEDDTDDSFWKFKLHFMFNETNNDWELDFSECIESP